MAITQLQRGPDAGQIFGKKLGEGIESGVEALLNRKLSEMNKRKLGEKYEELGYPKQLGYVDQAFAKQYGGNIDTQRESARLAAAEAPFLDELSQRYNTALGTDFITPGLLKTKQGKDFIDQIVSSKLKNEQIETKAASAPLSLGEAINSSFGYTPERIKKQQTILEKVGSKRKIKSQDIFSDQEIKEMKQRGINPDQVAQRLQKEHLSSSKGEQSATQKQEQMKEAEYAQSTSEEDKGASPLQLLSSLLTGAAKGKLGLTPPFAAQTLVSGGLDLTNLLSRLATGENIAPSYEELQERVRQAPEPEQPTSILGKTLEVMRRGIIGDDFTQNLSKATGIKPNLPPTASQVANPLIEASTQGTPLEKYLVPQTEGQQKAENVGALASLSYKDVPGIAGKATAATKALSKSFGANTANWLTRTYTGSEDLGNLVGMGTLIGLNMFPGTFAKQASEKYAQVENEIIKPAMAEGKTVNFNKFADRIDKVENSAKQFRIGSPERTALDSTIHQVRQIVDNKGKVSPEKLWNNARSQNGNYKHIPALARHEFSKIIKIQQDALEDFGKQYNPKAAAALKEGNAIWRTMNENMATRKSIMNQIPLRRMGVATLAWMGGIPLPVIIGGAAGTYAAQTLLQSLKNPAIKSTLFQLAQAGAKNNIAAMNHLSTKLEKEMKNEDPAFYEYLEKYKDKMANLSTQENV